MVQMKSALGGIPVSEAMLRNFEALRPRDPLSRAVEITLLGSQKDFPVLDGGKLVGLLTQERLMAGLSKAGAESTVSSVLQEEIETADSHEMLEGALARIGSSGCRTAPVTHNGELVGLLTLDNVGELLRIQAALRDHDSHVVKMSA